MSTVFDTIKDRLPITEVLASYVTLIPSGNQLKAKCPFHNERSASFSVSPERGLYYCFGCGAKGDIFTFVEQFEGVDRKGALKILAERAGVTLTRDHTKRDSSDPLYELLERTTNRYQSELNTNTDAKDYLAKRGIVQSTIDNFRIGYAPDDWRYVANSMMSEQESSIGERAGLIKKTEKPASPSQGGGYYDRFRKRIMFPLTDSSGRVVGFSGRLYPPDTVSDKESPKYLNSPETELFQKSRILFGFDKAKIAIRQHNFAILVEGQIDCVLAHQIGFKNTVATSGTAVSDAAASDPSANLAVLARLTPNVFLAFDGDAAGQKALDRAAIVALSLSMNPKVVPLPEGMDPADYILANGADAWKELLKDSRHFILHQLRSINKHEVSAHVLVTKIKERVFPFLVRVQSPVEQSSYLESIAKHLDIPRNDIAHEFSLFNLTKEIVMPTVAPISPDISPTIEERFIALHQRYGNDKINERYIALINLNFDDHQIIIPEIDENKMSALISIIERDYGYLPEDERNLVFSEFAKKIEDNFFAKMRLNYSRLLEKADDENNETEVNNLLIKLQTLNQRRHDG